MTTTAEFNSDVHAGQRRLPLLLLLFVGSGCAALIYEIVWFQLLQLTIGSTAVSLGVLLATFMGGMCIGSLYLHRFVGRHEHPLRIYARLEIAIGVMALLLLFLMPVLGKLYSSVVGHGFTAILLRALLAAILLLPPTIAMGATLPAIARWIETSREGVSWLGFFYGGNIAGAVIGCLLAGFYLLRVHDMMTATIVGALLNFGVAAIAMSIAGRSQVVTAPAETRSEAAPDLPGSRLIYVVIAISGLTALASEVIWTRILGLILGATVYTFSIILAVFLTGLGIGSSVGSFASRQLVSPRTALALCQIGLTAAIAWTAFMVSNSIPYWPVDPGYSVSAFYDFQLDIVRVLWAVLPPALLWGASFPLALASVARPGQDPEKIVGRVYAANTVGAIFGALAASLILVEWIGTGGAQRLVIGLAALSALIALFSAGMLSNTTAGEGEAAVSSGGNALFRRRVLAAVAVVAAVVLVRTVPPMPSLLIAYGRYSASYAGKINVLYSGEGMNSSVAVTEEANGARNFHVSGKVEASSLAQDMRLQRLLGHMTALMHPEPKSVLIVGFGAGVTAGTFVLHPSIERIVICEIEPLIPEVVSTYFSAENYNVLNDPRVEVVFDDARHYLLTSREKFDVITSDPIHPWVKGSATLYTTEYFELAKRHLNPGGVMTQWVPLYESNDAVVKSEIATFFGVFGDGSIWANEVNRAGYDVVLLGRTAPGPIDVDALDARLNSPAMFPVLQSLADVGLGSTAALLSTYAGRTQDLRIWLADAEFNRDRNLRLQYLAGMQQSKYEQAAIYNAMLQYRKFPEDLFTGSDMLLEQLRSYFWQGQ